MKVGDVMTTEVRTIGPDAPIKEAAMVMVKAGISGLPVVDDDRKVVGIITEADFVTAEANRSWGRQRRRLLANLFGEAETHSAKTVEDAMTADPATIDRASSVTEAARKMTDLGVKRLPVVLPDGTIEGIISRADVMGAFAQARRRAQVRGVSRRGTRRDATPRQRHLIERDRWRRDDVRQCSHPLGCPAPGGVDGACGRGSFCRSGGRDLDGRRKRAVSVTNCINPE